MDNLQNLINEWRNLISEMDVVETEARELQIVKRLDQLENIFNSMDRSLLPTDIAAVI